MNTIYPAKKNLFLILWAWSLASSMNFEIQSLTVGLLPSKIRMFLCLQMCQVAIKRKFLFSPFNFSFCKCWEGQEDFQIGRQRENKSTSRLFHLGASPDDQSDEMPKDQFHQAAAARRAPVLSFTVTLTDCIPFQRERVPVTVHVISSDFVLFLDTFSVTDKHKISTSRQIGNATT